MKTLLASLIISISLLGTGVFFLPAAQAQDNPGLKDAFGQLLTDAAGEQGAGYDTSERGNVIARTSGIINIILYLLGAIFMAMILYSGIRWMTSGGNEQAIDKAKSTIKQAIIGLIIVVGAYALSYFFIQYFAS